MSTIDPELSPAGGWTGRHGERMARLAERALAGRGVLPAHARQAIAAGDFAGAGLPAPLAAWAARVAASAHEIDDAEVEVLRREGFSEDEIFEVAVAAALGAGMARLRAGLAALRGT